MLFGVGDDDGDGVPVLEDLLVAQDRTIPAVTLVGGKGDQTGNAILAFDILVGNNLDDARRLLCCRGVDPLDVCMRHVSERESSVEGAFGKLVGFVVAEIPETADLGDGCGTRVACPENGAICRRLVIESGCGHLATQNLGCGHCRIDDGDVAGAAAGIPVLLEPVTHVLPCRVRVGIEERLDGDHESGGAETALDCAVKNECLLDWVEVYRRADTFSGNNRRPVFDPFHFHGAGANKLAVQDDITGAARSGSAPDLDTGQVELLPQHVGQERFLIDDQMPLDTIHFQHLLNHTSSSFGFV